MTASAHPATFAFSESGHIDSIGELRGLKVHVRSQGDGVIIGARMRCNDMYLYSVAMMLPYEVIRRHGIYHTVLAWHHFMMMSSAQEAITEGRLRNKDDLWYLMTASSTNDNLWLMGLAWVGCELDLTGGRRAAARSLPDLHKHANL